MKTKPFGNSVFNLLLLKFILTLNYSLLAIVKRTIIAMDTSNGVENIPYIKSMMLPTSLFITILYAFVSKKVTLKSIYRVFVIPIVIFYIIFAFILYPNSSITTSSSLITNLFNDWPKVLFYLLSEIWGVFIINVIYWNLVNITHTIKKATLVYTLFSASGDLGQMTSYPITLLITKLESLYPALQNNPNLPTQIYVILVSTLAILAMYLYETTASNHPQTVNKPKSKTNLRQDFKTIIKSKHTLCIALIVLSYSVSINYVEQSWLTVIKQEIQQIDFKEVAIKKMIDQKSKTNQLNENDVTLTDEEYNIAISQQNIKRLQDNHFKEYQARIQGFTGLIACLFTLFIARPIVRSLSWRTASLIPPIFIGVLGISFMLLLYITLHQHTNSTTLRYLVTLGSIYIVSAKTLKYAIFDPTKEIAYIPLSKQEKTNSKASVDLFGSRLGKSGSSMSQALLHSTYGGSINDHISVIIPFITGTFIVWILAIFSMNKRIEDHQASEESRSV